MLWRYYFWETVPLKRWCHRIFWLWFFHLTTFSSSVRHAFKGFQICLNIQRVFHICNWLPMCFHRGVMTPWCIHHRRVKTPHKIHHVVMTPLWLLLYTGESWLSGLFLPEIFFKSVLVLVQSTPRNQLPGAFIRGKSRLSVVFTTRESWLIGVFITRDLFWALGSFFPNFKELKNIQQSLKGLSF